tara:strand:- start:8755 stop:9312 length:558 start_codon:yes stop_codon:yes gene_type:complete
MRKKIFLTILISFSFILGLEANTRCSIDKQLNKDTLSKLSEFRTQTQEICLKCSGKKCQLKDWPVEKSNDAAVCKLLFCTASYVSRVVKMPDDVKPGKSLISFNFFLTDKGRIKGVDITNVKGEMNDRQAYKYITSFAKKTRFEPLILDGNVYQLSNLSGQVVAISGPLRDLEDNMPHDSGIWRN